MAVKEHGRAFQGDRAMAQRRQHLLFKEVHERLRVIDQFDNHRCGIGHMPQRWMHHAARTKAVDPAKNGGPRKPPPACQLHDSFIGRQGVRLVRGKQEDAA